jgi:hypothetical protein
MVGVEGRESGTGLAGVDADRDKVRTEKATT